MAGFVKQPACSARPSGSRCGIWPGRFRTRTAGQAAPPAYMLGCKRILLSSNYYPALTQPNTELVTAGLAKVDGRTLTAQDGTARDADVIVFATGFHVIDMPVARRITGAAGVTLAADLG